MVYFCLYLGLFCVFSFCSFVLLLFVYDLFDSRLKCQEEDEVVASEECHEVFARLQGKGIDVSMDTIKR